MSVYVVNKYSHDLSDAERFGELIYITEGRVNFFRLDDVVKAMTSKIINSKPNDYLLPSGNVVLNDIACIIWMSIHKKVQLLIFDAKSRSYVRRDLDLYHVEKTITEELNAKFQSQRDLA